MKPLAISEVPLPVAIESARNKRVRETMEALMPREASKVNATVDAMVLREVHKALENTVVPVVKELLMRMEDMAEQIEELWEELGDRS